MNTTPATDIQKLRISLRWLWTGPVGGIIAMIALFVYGLVIGSPQLVVIASSTAAVLGGLWVSLHVALRHRLARVAQ